VRSRPTAKGTEDQYNQSTEGLELKNGNPFIRFFLVFYKKGFTTIIIDVN
jgi:hypothetical protein